MAARFLAGPATPATWRTVLALAISLVIGSVFCAVQAAALALAAAFCWVVGAGEFMLATALRLGARLGRADRGRIAHWYGRPINPPQLPARHEGQSWRQAQRDWRRCGPALRLAGYQLLRAPVAAASVFVLVICYWTVIGLVFVVPLRGRPTAPAFTSWVFGHGTLSPVTEAAAVLVGLAVLLITPVVVRGLGRLDAATGSSLLGPDRAELLTGEVSRLVEARALAADASDIERHRIERDLHDGVQPRLVSLAMQIDRARARLGRDPEASAELLRQAHADAKAAIADLRSIARGIHPAILHERGLDAALSALVAGCPVPCDVSVELHRRPARSQEAAAYFAAAEAIANLAKHSGASQAALSIRDLGGQLTVIVTDDGHGGAAVAPGGGLAGLAGRLAAVDGDLAITSPAGGPTRVTAVIPCGS